MAIIKRVFQTKDNTMAGNDQVFMQTKGGSSKRRRKESKEFEKGLKRLTE